MSMLSGRMKARKTLISWMKNLLVLKEERQLTYGGQIKEELLADSNQATSVQVKEKNSKRDGVYMESQDGDEPEVKRLKLTTAAQPSSVRVKEEPTEGNEQVTGAIECRG